MTRIAAVNNQKLKDMERKRHIASMCPVNRGGAECMYVEGSKLLINEELCIGCGICHNLEPETIAIINLPEELQETPVHHYGQNEFRLYNLPIPMFGKVVGIIGRNGIGKSTAIKILAGVLKPNLGEFLAEAGYAQLIDFFKGIEAQGFFKKLRDGKIPVAYKPQQIELIPKSASGKVKELLSRIDEKGELANVSAALGITQILSHDIRSVSGGELQRVAIAATVLRKANLYIFDELTSYLDMKQRLSVSRFIKSLADSETAVMVVEHDLIILDSLSDLIHMMYGKEDAYGVVSMPKSTKAGINEYLSGYLREENVRFRDKKITFEPKQGVEHKEEFVLISWSGVAKRLDSFSLAAESGQLSKGDVVGVLGENGIGKTTFVKILAGVLERDSGKIDPLVKVSYKPQYLDSDSEELVMAALSQAISKYSNQLVHSLDIKPLYTKKLCELSGGELQRVSIVACLSQDAQLYLLDEPSAYLDVEQRLMVSKVLRDFMQLKGATALVVDHDLLFIDYVSDRIAVFEGAPALHGSVHGPFSMEGGMTRFLKALSITFRRDEVSHRPRANKEGSVKDREQREKGRYYYS